MEDRLERIYEYRLLVGKRDSLSIPLSPVEVARVRELEEQLPAWIPAVTEQDQSTCLTIPLPVRMMVRGRLIEGSLCNASAAGLGIAVAAPPGLTEPGIVHVSEQAHGLEYSFPGRVISRVLKGAPSIGWSFEGVPSQMRLGKRSSGVWRHDQAGVTEPGLPRARVRRQG